MEQYIKKSDIVSEIESLKRTTFTNFDEGVNCAVQTFLEIIDTLEVKEIDLELENENKNPKITVGTKIRLKTNPNVIISIISTDCHEDEFECSNGSVLSLKQIEKYYNIYIDENNGKQI